MAVYPYYKYRKTTTEPRTIEGLVHYTEDEFGDEYFRIAFFPILGIIIVIAIIIAYWLGKGASILYNKVIKNIRI